MDGIPVHWCFPACVFDDENGIEPQFDRMLKRRQALGTDMLLPRGYSAAPHTHLLRNDILRDLQWAIHNPWHPGAREMYADKLPVIFPANPDWSRENTREIYTTWADRLLLELVDAATGGACYVLRYPKETPRLLAVHRVPDCISDRRNSVKKAVQRLKRSAFPLALHITAAETDPPGRVSEQLDGLLSLLPAAAFGSIDELPAQSSREEPKWRTVPVPCTPADLKRLQENGYGRTEISASSRSLQTRKRSSVPARAITRQRLRALAPGESDKAERDRDAGDIGIIERTLIADMSGEISLCDGDVCARFEEGRLSSVFRGEQAVICEKPVSSYYMIENLRCEFTNHGAFSFESEHVHGLRTSQTIRGSGIVQEGRVVRDYFFIEDEPGLFISTVYVFPVFEQGVLVQKWAPFELPLFGYHPDEEIAVESKAPDGERSVVELTDSAGCFCVAGNAFRLKKGNHVVDITYPEDDSGVFRQLPVRIEKNGRKAHVSITPEGCYAPVPGKRFSGFAVHSVFTIDVQTGGSEG
ncbi:MAG: hypothetical protein JW852_03285, partial [Spirochaetales bacterium]|nr:hypothetical protein [Spirochaetales bacterium]